MKDCGLDWRRVLADCRRLAVACVIVLVAAWRPAAAQDELKIAAVVNDDVITQLDVFERLRMAMVSAKLEDTPEMRQRLLPAVMRSLIDDRLKLQESKAQGVTVGDGEVNGRIDLLAKRNGMTREDFEAMLSSNGIMVTALSDQIRAELSWNRLVQRSLRSNIHISDAEIDEAQANAKSAQGQTEYHLARIFLAVDTPKDAPTVQQTAQRLYEQLQGGADFASLAQQFSQDTSASDGGDLGWKRIDEVEPAAVAKELTQGGASLIGKTIGPILGTGGYFLVQVIEQRTGESTSIAPGTVHMVRLLWPLTPNASDAEVKATQAQADAFGGKKASTCQEFERLGDDAANARFTDLGNVPLADMPPEIRDYAINQPIGSATPAIRGNGGVAVFMVCDRGAASGEASRVAIADRLAAARLETLARGYLSDLRRAAYIDIRL